MNPVYFVGAGPGDPELLTIKAYHLLQQADLIIWAGSLINTAVVQNIKPEADLVDSSGLTLEQIVDRMEAGFRKGLLVVRLHTGDPAIYGAINEQIDLLQAKEIPYQIIPGVSSFLAAAASLGIEYTIPELTQTVILTRMEGRTPVPTAESITELAKHRSSLCIFLSVHQIEELILRLKQVLPEKTPVAVVEKASWPEEVVVTGTLANIEAKVQAAGIRSTALIVVGECLKARGYRSKLYDQNFTHGYRQEQVNGV